MSKEILSKSKIIKKISKEIRALEFEEYCKTNVHKLENSKGLTADEVNQLISKLGTTQEYIERILESLPKKLERVADTFEGVDKAAASQFEK